MDALEQARAEIDTVDAQLAALFERRMAAVLQVAEYKRAHGLPVYDAARETAVLEKAAARIQDPALRPYYKDHVQNLMDVAKQYEAVVLGQNRAAYQGVEGAFAHIALRALFPHAEAVSYPTWDEVFDAVERGDAARGVVPFENSHAGDVSAVLDLCYNHPALWVVDVYDLPISQNLLVLPGTKLDQIKSVYSHQQAIAQEDEDHGTDAEVHEVLHDDVAGVFGPREATLHHGKATLHEEHEDGTDQKPDAKRYTVHTICSFLLWGVSRN